MSDTPNRQAQSEQDLNKQQVVLLHGLGRSPRSMRKLEKVLTQRGYKVLNAGYIGLVGDYQAILKKLIIELTHWVDPSSAIHFVGHSFGGILIRGLLNQCGALWTLGRCVMLGTPNQGTSTASYMSTHPILKYFTPEVAKQLTPESELIRRLPEPTIETGVIAGSKSSSILVPVTWFYNVATNNAPGDGVVEINNTQCSNMSDFLVMPLHHSFMMWDSRLIEQVIHFLRFAKFEHLQPAQDNLAAPTNQSENG